jgi:hypothetical protein
MQLYAHKCTQRKLGHWRVAELGTITGLADYQSVPHAAGTSSLDGLSTVQRWGRFLRNEEKPASRQLRRLHCANIMNSSAPAQATHHAIEIARNQVSRVIGLKQRPPVETASSQLGDTLEGIHRELLANRTFDLYQGSKGTVNGRWKRGQYPAFLHEQNNDRDGDGAKPKCHDTRAVK